MYSGLDSTKQLKILAVTSELPWPLNTGGHIRTFQLLRALAKRFAVRLVTTATRRQEAEQARLADYGIDLRPGICAERRIWREFIRAAAAATRGEPYVLYRRHDRRAVRARVREELQRDPPDLLYLDHLDATVFWRHKPPCPVILDLHNVYSTLVRRTAEERSIAARWYLLREAMLLEKMERRAVNLADVVLAVSDLDAEHFSTLGCRNVRVVPNGVDCGSLESLPAGRFSDPPIILYVGAMSWEPNVKAAQFLAEHVLPKVQRVFPSACLRIVGRDPTSTVLALERLPGVEVKGAVASMTPHLQAARVLAVPLESGGGTRLKILEAFAAGLPVVSTPIGCEGLAVSDGEHLVVANREMFAENLCRLFANPDLAAKLSVSARELVRQHYDWNSIGTSACEAVSATVRKCQE